MKIKKILAIVLFVWITASQKDASAKISSHILIDSTQTEYTLIKKSESIESVKFKKSKKAGNTIYIIIGSAGDDNSNSNRTAIGLSNNFSKGDQNNSGPLFDNIQQIKGGYQDIKVIKKSDTKNLYTLTNVSFPLNLIMHAGKEFVQFELKEAGRWDIDINFKK